MSNARAVGASAPPDGALGVRKRTQINVTQMPKDSVAVSHCCIWQPTRVSPPRTSFNQSS